MDFKSKPTAPATVSADGATTLATKGYVDEKSGIIGNIDGGKVNTVYGGFDSIKGGDVDGN